MSDKQDGAAVRRAIDGPDIEHDELIAFIAARNEEDRGRASDAGESRQSIGEFIERTGMNGKALSFMRQILKANDRNNGQAKAMDIILSVEKALPMIKAHVAGQGTPDMFPEDAIEGAKREIGTSGTFTISGHVAPPTTSGDADFDAEIDKLFPEAAE